MRAVLPRRLAPRAAGLLLAWSSACAAAPAGSWPHSEEQPDARQVAADSADVPLSFDAAQMDGHQKLDAPPSPPDATPADARPTVPIVVEAALVGAVTPASPTFTCSGLPQCASVSFSCPSCSSLISGSGSAAIVNDTAILSFSLAGVAEISAATVTATVRGSADEGVHFQFRNQAGAFVKMGIPAGLEFVDLSTDWTSMLVPGVTNSVAAVRTTLSVFLLRRIRVELSAILE